MHTTQVYQHVRASRAAVYRALLDAEAVTRWRVPPNMSSRVHEFDAREGGAFRVSLTYDSPDAAGKSARHTDTYHGHFARLVPDERVVEVLEFETADPALRGTMTITTTLTDADGGTDVSVVHEGVPDGVSAADNELGTRLALAQLAELVEADDHPGDPKGDLRRYLQAARDALLWKLDGLSEYDLRRPLTPTGTNLLGLVKHVALVEAGYLGETFGRPLPAPLPGLEDDAEPNADMWATRDESRDVVVSFYRRVWEHCDETIEALPLDATGHVPWWPAERNTVTLHRILVHVIAETHRHAGHADIVRELVDGAAGLREGGDNLAPGDQAWWRAYRDRLLRVAQEARGS